MITEQYSELYDHNYYELAEVRTRMPIIYLIAVADVEARLGAYRQIAR